VWCCCMFEGSMPLLHCAWKALRCPKHLYYEGICISSVVQVRTSWFEWAISTAKKLMHQCDCSQKLQATRVRAKMTAAEFSVHQ
jgi:hypothetical protein